MYTVDSLERAIRNLFRGGIENGYRESQVTALLEDIDYPTLLQAVRHRARTVYAYTTQSQRSKLFSYRGADLFGQRATMLYDAFDLRSGGKVATNRTYELWLLEDMTIAAVVRVSITYDSGAYKTVYRGIREEGPWNCGMFLDLHLLTYDLHEMCRAVYKGRQPVYEL